MTRAEQQAKDKRYADWKQAYIDDVRERVKHWGDKRKGSTVKTAPRNLDPSLFEPGRE